VLIIVDMESMTGINIARYGFEEKILFLQTAKVSFMTDVTMILRHFQKLYYL
jgi:hypothetical protein